ncbi:hypothetical protein V5799_016242 [Amblyomma americanum]|uniref:Uncharacterized protein n=1 Tax=Amblyomma americanum TaxID=6943 RepID=A0AAQ4F5Q3_AMBAM
MPPFLFLLTTLNDFDLQFDMPALQIFANFPYGVAITDIDNDDILDCLSAKRKDFDPEAKTVTYVWSLNGGEGNNSSKQKNWFLLLLSVLLLEARSAQFVPRLKADYCDSNIQENFFVAHLCLCGYVHADSDNVEVAHFRYTDYKDCAIVEVPHFGDECVLFVSKEKENDVPASCLEQFSDICGEAISLRERHPCVVDETDEEDY